MKSDKILGLKIAPGAIGWAVIDIAAQESGIAPWKWQKLPAGQKDEGKNRTVQSSVINNLNEQEILSKTRFLVSEFVEKRMIEMNWNSKYAAERAGLSEVAIFQILDADSYSFLNILKLFRALKINIGLIPKGKLTIQEAVADTNLKTSIVPPQSLEEVGLFLAGLRTGTDITNEQVIRDGKLSEEELFHVETGGKEYSFDLFNKYCRGINQFVLFIPED